MQKYREAIQDGKGNKITTASVRVKINPGGADAIIYSDNGVTPKINPFSPDADGIAKFWAANGRYNIEVTAGGTTVIDENVLFEEENGGLVVDTVAALRAMSPPANNTKVFVLGYYTAGDGGGGPYYYDAASSGADNGGTIIQPGSLPAAGRWFFQNASLLTAKTFGAKIDGVTDDYNSIVTYIGTLQSGDNMVIPAGTCVIGSKVTVILPRNITITCHATLQFSGLAECMEFTGLGLDVYIRQISCLSLCGVAVVVKSCMRSRFDIEFEGGANITTAAYKLVGRYNTLDGDGTQLNGIITSKFESRYINTVGDAFLVTTETNGSPGYVNENEFHAKWLDANNGIRFVKGVGQTDPFNGNQLYLGLENIATDGIRFEFARRNTVFSPRFENIGQWEVYEDSECQQNLYFIGYSNFHTKWSMNGLTARIVGNGRSNDGGLIYREALQNQDGEWIYIADKYHVDMPNNTLFYKRNHVGKGIFDGFAFGIKDSAGVFRDAGRLDPTGSELVTGIAGTHQVQNKISYLRASTSSGNLSLKMPSIQETNGVFILLDFYYDVGGSLEILNSAGVSHIAAGELYRGLWILTYDQGAWKASKISANQCETTPGNNRGGVLWNPGLIADGSGLTSANITVVNALVTNHVKVFPPYSMQGVNVFGWVDSTGVVKIRVENNTGAGVTLGNGTYIIEVENR